MFCNKCGNPLPKEGAVCKFCGAMMSEEQIKMIQEQKKEQEFRPELMTEKYGQKGKIVYREETKSNNLIIYLAVVGGLVLFIIILAIILNS